LLILQISDQPQPFELVTFALLRQRSSASKFSPLTSPQSNNVVRILEAWFAASAPHHNVEAFLNGGLTAIERNEIFYLEGQFRHARHFRIWPSNE
jgi:hypothetical protein